MIRRGNCELAVEVIRYFNMLVTATLVLVGRYLTTGDAQLRHQLTGQPAPHFDAGVPGNDARDASGAGGAAAGVPGLHDLAAFSHALAVWLIDRSLPVPVAAAMYLKGLAQDCNGVSRP